jgi:hypothetical protein
LLAHVLQLAMDRRSFVDARVSVAKGATLALLSSAISKVTGVPRELQRLIKAEVRGSKVTGAELLTNVMMGVPPSPEGAEVFQSPPLDSLSRVVGDGLRLTDLKPRFYEKVVIFLEKREAPVCMQPFDPFPSAAVLAPASRSHAWKPDDPVGAETASNVDVFGTSSDGPSSENPSSTSDPELASHPLDSVTIASAQVTNGVTYSVNPALLVAPAPAASASSYACDIDHGFRAISIDSSPALALLEKLENTGAWTYVMPGTDNECTLNIDVRCTARELYAIMSDALGLPFGTFQLQKDSAYAPALRISDDPNVLRTNEYSPYKDGSLVIKMAPALLRSQFLTTLMLYVPPADVIHGTSWAPVVSPPPAPSGTCEIAAPSSRNPARCSDAWIPSPIPMSLVQHWASNTSTCVPAAATMAGCLRPVFSELLKCGLSAESTIDDIRSLCIPALITAGKLSAADVEAGTLPPPPQSDHVGDASRAPIGSTEMSSRITYAPSLLRRLRMRIKVRARGCQFMQFSLQSALPISV